MIKPNLNSVKSFLRMDQLGVDNYLDSVEEKWNAQDSYGRLTCIASGGGLLTLC